MTVVGIAGYSILQWKVLCTAIKKNMCDKNNVKPLSSLITGLMLSIFASDCVYYTLFYTTSYIRLSELKKFYAGHGFSASSRYL
jgi:hypothetical protein